MEPTPIIPDYHGRCLTRLLGVVGRQSGAIDDHFSDLGEALQGSSATVLVILDGLGAGQLDDRTEVAPLLAAGRLAPVMSVAPSTTVTALTSLSTGAAPGSHGLVGYRFVMDNAILQALQWKVDGRDAQQRFVPEVVCRATPLMRRGGTGVPYVAEKRFEMSGFTKAHLTGSTFVPFGDPEEIGTLVERALVDHAFVVVYLDAIDKTAHQYGLELQFDQALSSCEATINDLRRRLHADVAIVVTADHGQVDVGPTTVTMTPATLSLVNFMSGEGRFRWLHAHPEQRTTLLERVSNELQDSCWVYSRRQAISLGLFGEVDDDVNDRFGDVAVIPFLDQFVPDPTEKKEHRMRSRHGSLTEAEMWVPLVVL